MSFEHSSQRPPTADTPESSPERPPNGAVRIYRKVYGFFGFNKSYNFPLFIIFVGAMLGFFAYEVPRLDIGGYFLNNTVPGEQFYYQNDTYTRVGITLHLAGIIPGLFLACFQFVPKIRHKAILFHRINGYIVILLTLLANAGALMLINVAVGGAPVLQLTIGLMGFWTTLCLVLSVWNVKRLQIDLHRAWMLRAWAYLCTIITLRLFLDWSRRVMVAQQIDIPQPIPCAQIHYMYGFLAGLPDEGNPTALIYEACGENAKTNMQRVLVSSIGTGPESFAAQIHALFAMSWVLAVFFHGILVETYLWLTPAENYRLRLVSYEKQVKAGIRRAGAPKGSGTGASRFGDAPIWWDIPQEELNSSTSAKVAV